MNICYTRMTNGLTLVEGECRFVRSTVVNIPEYVKRVQILIKQNLYLTMRNYSFGNRV